MKIDPDCLRTVRRKKGFTRPELEKLSGITVRTIQRLEQEPHRSQKTREDTLNRLAKALSVEPDVLTGDLPLPESDDTLSDDLDRVPIGAQIAPKTRLAYDLIKYRYNVSATEIINMAPLFFVLLASGSLAWRKEKLRGSKEAIELLEGDEDDEWNMFVGITRVQKAIVKVVDKSISRADIFGEDLFDYFRKLMILVRDGGPALFMAASHMVDDGQLAEQMPSQNEIEDFFSSDEWREEFLRSAGPFAQYLKMLARENADIVSVGDGGLWSRFPNYDIYPSFLNEVANNSPVVRIALEIGLVRLSQIPDELRAEGVGEEREKWLKEKLSDELQELMGDSRYDGLSEEEREKWICEKLVERLEESSTKKIEGV